VTAVERSPGTFQHYRSDPYASPAKVTFDVLFNMLVAFGLDYKVVTRKAA